MTTRQFQFPRREFDKYDRFRSFDPELDIKTSFMISRELKVMLYDIYNHTEKVVLKHGSEEYETVEGYYAFYKALFTHLAITYWQQTVGTMEITRDLRNSRGMEFLINMKGSSPLQGHTTEKFYAVMPRFARGIFNEPIRIIELFSLTFGVEYTLSMWMLDSGESFGVFRPDMETRTNYNKASIERTITDAKNIIQRGY